MSQKDGLGIITIDEHGVVWFNMETGRLRWEDVLELVELDLAWQNLYKQGKLNTPEYHTAFWKAYDKRKEIGMV